MSTANIPYPSLQIIDENQNFRYIYTATTTTSLLKIRLS